MDILSVLSSIPRDADPYTYLHGYLLTSVVPATGTAFSVNLIICSVLQAIALLLALALLRIKIRNGETWLVKRKKTNHGVLLLPNSGLLFLVFAVVYLVVAQIDVWSQCLSAQHGEAAVLLSTYIPCYKVLALFAALWSETFGYAASAFLFKYERDERISGRSTARFFNAFFLFGYVWAFVPTLVIGIQAPIEYHKGWIAAKGLLLSLDEASKQWDGKSGINIQPSWLGQFDRFYNHLMEHLHLLEITYQLYLALFLLITSLYFAASFLYVRCLKQQIRRDFVTLNRAHFDGQDTRSEQTAALRLTYKLLLAKAACIGAMAIMLVAFVMAPVTNYHAFYESVRLYSIIVAGQFYPFSCFGLAILALQAYGVWKNPAIENSRHGVRQALGLPFSLVDQISISTETAIAIDQGAKEDDIALKPTVYKIREAFPKQEDEKSIQSIEAIQY